MVNTVNNQITTFMPLQMITNKLYYWQNYSGLLLIHYCLTINLFVTPISMIIKNSYTQSEKCKQ